VRPSGSIASLESPPRHHARVSRGLSPCSAAPARQTPQHKHSLFVKRSTSRVFLVQDFLPYPSHSRHFAYRTIILNVDFFIAVQFFLEDTISLRSQDNLKSIEKKSCFGWSAWTDRIARPGFSVKVIRSSDHARVTKKNVQFVYCNSERQNGHAHHLQAFKKRYTHLRKRHTSPPSTRPQSTHAS
jgi:hypothetical protein